MKKIIIKILFPALFLTLFFSSLYTSADPVFKWPVDVPKSLSATLGETRGSHLHMGIDIKTNGRPGYPVFAAGAGNLARIVSKETGYGNAIFIDHGGKIESVYGHLDSFAEGKNHIDSLVRIIKVLYNNEPLDFKFSQSKLKYNKNEKVAYAGESGAGIPHLHFEIRENNIFRNPLNYIHVPDTKAPVIHGLFVCIEKDNATVYERKINVKKKWGYYTLSKNPIEIEGDKIFFKLSCYDRVGAYNHVAVHRIKVFENRKKIFELVFDILKRDELQYGAYVYDISKSSIKGQVSYVYSLCRKEGNNYKGIKTSGDGYINIKCDVKNKKQIRIIISDFAGNEERLQFSVRGGKTANNYGNYAKIENNKNNSIADKEKNIKILIRKKAVESNTLIQLENRVTQKIVDELCSNYSINKSDLLNICSVYPHDTVYKKPVQISFKKPSEISGDDTRHIQIFCFFEGKKPKALKTNYVSRKTEFQAESYTNGFFALIIDKTPPKIFLPPTFEFCEDRNIHRKIRINTSDNLSRINKESIHCIIDGDTYPTIFDEDRKWIEVTLPREIISNGMHHIFVRARDEANNEAVFRSLLTFD